LRRQGLLVATAVAGWRGERRGLAEALDLAA
jgi:hypothetical protein